MVNIIRTSFASLKPTFLHGKALGIRFTKLSPTVTKTRHFLKSYNFWLPQPIFILFSPNSWLFFWLCYEHLIKTAKRMRYVVIPFKVYPNWASYIGNQMVIGPNFSFSYLKKSRCSIAFFLYRRNTQLRSRRERVNAKRL